MAPLLRTQSTLESSTPLFAFWKNAFGQVRPTAPSCYSGMYRCVCTRHHFAFLFVAQRFERCGRLTSRATLSPPQHKVRLRTKKNTRTHRRRAASVHGCEYRQVLMLRRHVRTTRRQKERQRKSLHKNRKTGVAHRASLADNSTCVPPKATWWSQAHLYEARA